MSDARPEIIVGDLPVTVAAAIRALARTEVYQRSGVLVHVAREAATDEQGIVRPAGTPRIRSIPPGLMRLNLHESAVWKKWHVKRGKGAEDPELVDCAVPVDVLRAVHELGEWPHIRPLRGVIDYPVLRPDGSVLSERGYDRQTGLLCEPNVHISIADAPSQEMATSAANILADLVQDFPFGTPAHAAAWVSSILTIVARPAILGPVPALLIDANTQASGKTLLAEIIGEIALGRSLPRRALPKDPAEWSKTLLSVAMAGDPVLLFDNVKQVIGGDALEAMLTGTAIASRVLGTSDDLSLDWRALMIFSANNATLSTDLVRRSLHVRLESKVERPEERTGFKFPDILDHARAERASLLGAALTILRGYFAAGCPKVPMRTMGSFDAWSRVVRGAMIWAGCPDPAETQEALREVSDTDLSALEVFFKAWHRRYKADRVTCADVLRDVDRASTPLDAALKDALLSFCDDHGKPPSAKRLGARLRNYRSKIVAGLVLQSTEKGERGVMWRVIGASSQGEVLTLLPLLTLKPIPRTGDLEGEGYMYGSPESQLSLESQPTRLMDGVAE